MPDIVCFLIFIFAVTMGCILWAGWCDRRLRARTAASSRVAPKPERRLLMSEGYWAGLAAGARFLGTYRTRAEIDTCWDGMLADQLHGDQTEQDFATGWMRSVMHMRDRVEA